MVKKAASRGTDKILGTWKKTERKQLLEIAPQQGTRMM